MPGESPHPLRAGDLGLVCWAMFANVAMATVAFDWLALLTPLRVTILSAVLTWALVRACGLRIGRDPRLSLGLLGACLVAVFLASDLTPHYRGGQDQGYYTAMAELLARAEPITFADSFRSTLPPELRSLYDSLDLPSVQRFPDGTTTLLFYPLHPALMSLARQLFGTGYHTVSMIAAFLVVVVTAYLFTWELSKGNRGLAAAAAWLFALNPGLVYFAKFPVSELTATAFLLPAGYHMLAGFNSARPRMMLFYGISTTLFVLAYCLTRMSFPMLLPFLGLLAVIVVTHPRFSPREKINCIAVIGAVALAFACSLLYYRWKQPRLLIDTVHAVYVPALWENRWLALSGTSCLLVIAGTAMFKAGRRSLLPLAVAKASGLGIRWLLRYPLLVLLILSLPSATFLISTGTLPGYDIPGGMPGLEMIRFHPLYVLMLLMSPFLFCVLFRIDGVKDQGSLLFVVLFVLVTWPVFLSFTKAIPSLYYFGRRFLPEILPFVLIAAVTALGGFSVIARRIILGLAVLWSSAFSAMQLGTSDGEINRPFHAIADHLHKHDVLLLLASDFDYWQMSQVVIPLRYSLGINTFVVNPSVPEVVQNVAARTRQSSLSRVYLLSTGQLATRSEWKGLGATPIDKITLQSRRLLPIWASVEKWPEFLLPDVSVPLEPTELYLFSIDPR